MFTCVMIDLGGFGLGHVAGIGAARRTPFRMNGKHDPRRLLAPHAEKPLQHVDHELHRRVVVIEHDHPEHRRTLEFGLCFLDEQVSIPPGSRLLRLSPSFHHHVHIAKHDT